MLKWSSQNGNPNRIFTFSYWLQISTFKVALTQYIYLPFQRQDLKGKKKERERENNKPTPKRNVLHGNI